MFKKTLLALTITATAAITATTGQAQQTYSPVVGNPQWVGCGDTNVHGSFNVQLCSNGSYRIVGGGIFCQGGISHWLNNGRLNIRLNRTQCGNGTAWSGGTFTCTFTSGTLSGRACTYRVTREARAYGWRNENVRFY